MPVEAFISYLRFELNRSPLTAEAYERDIRQFAEWLNPAQPDSIPVADVTTADIRGWLATLSREGHTPRTLRRKAQSLRAFFRFLLKQKEIAANPTADLILPKLPKNLPDHVRPEEVEHLLKAEEETIALSEENEESAIRDHLIIEMLYSLGLRRAELIALDDSDISHTGAEIKVTGKRAKQRIVPAPERLLDSIREWQRLRDSLWPDTPEPRPLFIVNGKRITPSQVYTTVKRCLSPTTARKKSPHALRHTFATAMLNEGADLNSVKEFLGHTTLSTTQIYTHISFSEMRKAYDRAHPRAEKKKFQ